MSSMAQPLVLSALAIGSALAILRTIRDKANVEEKRKANNGVAPPNPDDVGAAPIILKNKQGVEIYARRWDSSSTDPKALVIMIHGDLLWSQFFKETAGTLTSKGFTVYTFDLVGYGSSGCVGGLKRHVDRFEDYLSDLELVIDFAKSEKPGVPCFVFGEDLGGTLALAYSMDQERAQKVAGLMVSSPMLAAPELTGSVSSFASSIFPLAPGPKWKLGYTFADLFSDPTATNLAGNAFEEQNPPTVRKISELQKLCEYVKGNPDKVSVPLLLMHGEKDVRNPVKLSLDFQSMANNTTTYFRPYPDYKHGLLSDIENSRYAIGDIQGWLFRQCKELDGGQEDDVQPPPASTENIEENPA